ncbi:unnamed protein product [Adineta ricciae]|uniref:Tudor domain-containing protein n=1 Tax=Adineta ricciae TaxID=249248 RepID=A0A816DJ08_ADIRI|nr:unnamed protein product [Adineta ricciae]
MTYDSNGTAVLDEIDRLFVVCEKAKEYVNKISMGIDQQIELWQYRRRIITDQMHSPSSLDFLLPKTQRINELTIEAVQALCRVDLLVEQILRIDPKSVVQTRPISTSQSFSARPIDTNVPHSTINSIGARLRHPAPTPVLNSVKQQSYVEPMINGRPITQSMHPIPVLRTPQQTSTTRLPSTNTQEKTSFKPIEQQYPQRQQQQHQSTTISERTPRPTPMHVQANHYAANDSHAFARPISTPYETRTPPSESIASPMPPPSNSQVASSYRRAPPRDKVKVKLQRIPPDTVWKQAKIDVIDSLSAFYVENHDPRVREVFDDMLENLHEYYDTLEQTNSLTPLVNVSIGDFGVAKYSEDNRWYRARLLMCEENDQIRIVFIDFGNIETKDIQEFYPLDKLFTELPAQAIACTLSRAFPRSPTEYENVWSQDIIKIFREVVTNRFVEVIFVPIEDGTQDWPLHFVTITVDNQSVTNIFNLKQYIEPKSNCYIAEQLAESISHQEYILFNVPINGEEFE